MTDNTHHPTDDSAAHAHPIGAAEAAPEHVAGELQAPLEPGQIPHGHEAHGHEAHEHASHGHDGHEAHSEQIHSEEGHSGDDAHSGETPSEESHGHAAPPAPVEEEERGPIEEIVPSNDPPDLRWYILKVQSNREESIREGLQRRVHMAGLDRFFGDIIVPVEMVSEFKGGKKRVVKRKLYPGYLVVNMEINDETWFLVRETPGIGDFTGSAGKPSPMLPHEVSKIIAKQEEKSGEAPKLKINFNKGDRVKINEGTFENFEGDVDSLNEASGRVTVMINIFGRPTPVELEYWQIEAL